MIKILFVFGTRPEVIKMAPLIHAFQEQRQFKTSICFTGQHREMAKQVMEFFDLRPDYSLDLMVNNQTLCGLTANLFNGLNDVLATERPDLLFVQGDTTSTFAGALSGFYHRIAVAHLEAGLRSHRKDLPFPEEINRVLTSRVADYHFAPTERSRTNLLDEGVAPEAVHVVGNTVIDALFWGLQKIEKQPSIPDLPQLSPIDFSKKIILVTGHRRESFGPPFLEICEAIRDIAATEDVEVVYPVHLNPNVVQPVYSILSGRDNVHLLPPLDYATMIYLMSKAYIVLTDSGGIQEEAPSLRKPVLVMRDVTERPEGLEFGVSILVGTQRERIIQETLSMLHDRDAYEKVATGRNPYGDGQASLRIRTIVEQLFAKGITNESVLHLSGSIPVGCARREDHVQFSRKRD
jgi:UDP-N-acetylglucosamine 2-epimerase (non-hydrolysing)